MTAAHSADSGSAWQQQAARTLLAEVRQCWRRGEPPDLEEMLRRHPGASCQELATAIRLDQSEHWRQGRKIGAAEYLARFASRLDREAAIDVIYADFLLREGYGENPQIEAFQQSFPQYADVLREQIGLHQAFQEPKQRHDDGGAEVTDPAPSELEAQYQILDEIGRGGMGVVYRARQFGLNRLVALKMMRTIDCHNPELQARFRAEAEVVASLHHPGIVAVFDYGEHDGQPYLVMQLLEGGSLADCLTGVPWPPTEAAKLLALVARAVEFAHQRGVVHRDLKPANLLLAADEKRDVKIADFGLAKVFRDDVTPHTGTSAFLGTPSYMAPEQARGHARQIGPAADIYALGAILYELLTGRPPHLGENPVETLQQVVSTGPVSVNRLAPRVPRDLATICMKCLAHEPRHRYETAASVAGDLERFLADRPILARRTSTAEHVWRWCRRNPPLAFAAGAAIALLALVAIVSTWYSGRLAAELNRTSLAEQAERNASRAARQGLWDSYLATASAINHSHKVGQRFAALEVVDKARALLHEIGPAVERTLALRNATIASLALTDIQRVKEIREPTEMLLAHALAQSADLMVASYGRELVCRRLSDGVETARLAHFAEGAYPVISPDGQYLAATSQQGTRVWRMSALPPQVAWDVAGDQFLAFLPDGQHAVVGGVAGARLIVLKSGATVRNLLDEPVTAPMSIHAATGRIAVATDRQVQIIDSASGAKLGAFDSNVSLVAWHPDGAHLAVWERAGAVELWDWEARRHVREYRHRGFPTQLQFTADGTYLLSYTLWDRKLMAWDVPAGQLLWEARAFDVTALRQRTKGNLELLHPTARGVEVWELVEGCCQSLAFSGPDALSICMHVAAAPDNRLIALSGEQGLQLWDLETNCSLATMLGEHVSALFDQSGNLIVGSRRGLFRLPLAEADNGLRHYGPAVKLLGTGQPDSLAASSDGDVLLFEERAAWNIVRSGAAESQTISTTGDARMAAVSPDGQYAAIANWSEGGATVWKTDAGTAVKELPIGRTGVVQFSPDGRWLAATPDGVTLWRTSDWQEARRCNAVGTTPNGLAVCFSPDSRALAIGQPTGVLRLVDPETGQDWAQVAHADLSCASMIAFTPDQQRLIAFSHDDKSPGRVWDLVELRRELAARNLDWPATVLRATNIPSPASKLSVTIDADGLH